MTALAILASALQAIPPAIRRALLIVWALAVVAAGLVRVLGHDASTLEAVLLYVGGYLGVQSAANVLPNADVEPLPEHAEAPPTPSGEIKVELDGRAIRRALDKANRLDGR